ncbi:uncharacterized protein LOC143027889 [Oratosquilla oratoria]|uniref:uncharacterized protein LOC143027889 n=1 Tax=Oratosquilla oratoria TaxID=337810 RepID=UPI003F76F4F4
MGDVVHRVLHYDQVGGLGCTTRSVTKYNIPSQKLHKTVSQSKCRQVISQELSVLCCSRSDSGDSGDDSSVMKSSRSTCRSSTRSGYVNKATSNDCMKNLVYVEEEAIALMYESRRCESDVSVINSCTRSTSSSDGCTIIDSGGRSCISNWFYYRDSISINTKINSSANVAHLVQM